jgi:hypothetical protein
MFLELENERSRVALRQYWYRRQCCFIMLYWSGFCKTDRLADHFSHALWMESNINTSHVSLKLVITWRQSKIYRVFALKSTQHSFSLSLSLSVCWKRFLAQYRRFSNKIMLWSENSLLKSETCLVWSKHTQSSCDNRKVDCSLLFSRSVGSTNPYTLSCWFQILISSG